MKLSTRARYALRMMVVVTQEGRAGGPVNLGVVSAHTGISRRYLEQVSIALKGAGLLKGISGKHGGHLLGRAAKDITLLEIVEAAIGPVNVVECAGLPEGCVKSADCDSRELYRLLNHQLATTLSGFTLDDLATGRVAEKVRAEIGSESGRGK